MRGGRCAGWKKVKVKEANEGEKDGKDRLLLLPR